MGKLPNRQKDKLLENKRPHWNNYYHKVDYCSKILEPIRSIQSTDKLSRPIEMKRNKSIDIAIQTDKLNFDHNSSNDFIISSPNSIGPSGYNSFDFINHSLIVSPVQNELSLYFDRNVIMFDNDTNTVTTGSDIQSTNDNFKIKMSISRKNKVDVGIYVDDDIIKTAFQQTSIKNDNSYPDCNNSEINELYQLFKQQTVTLKTLIEWGDLYHKIKRVRCGSINLKVLYYLKQPLQELDKMIGLQKFKDNIVEQILLCLQGLHHNNESISQEMCHTVIYGPPGVGKTHLAKIIGHIYIAMGLIYKRPANLDHFNIDNYFETASRADLIGMYCGHTAVQTQKIIDRCRKVGKVLFIDETYSLGGDRSDRDNFSKECIDTINKNLTEGSGEFICIIAGYPEDIKKCFFSHNKGLERRFNFRYNIDKYSPSELLGIFMLKLRENGWNIENNQTITSDFFKQNEDYFPHFGGDIVTFLQKCKISHAKRIFAQNNVIHRQLNQDDIINGFKMYQMDINFKTKDKYLDLMYT